MTAALAFSTAPATAKANSPVVAGTIRVGAIAGLVQAIFSVFAWSNGWLLLYSDAQSHLTIARRLIDSQEPGFAMLGTVWLPVPHLLLAPFTANFTLWTTGFAGAILGVGAAAVSAGALWRITQRIGFPTRTRVVVLVVFCLNPSILYLYSTALTEPVLIASLLAATAGLATWIYSPVPRSMGQLAVFVGIPTGAAVLSRYEGWAFVAAASLFVLVTSWRRWQSWKYSIGLVLSYLAVPVSCVTWWVSYNWVVFGDPLSFARDQYSAAAQQQQLVDLGLLPTKSNLGLSVHVYNWDVVAMAGVPILALAAAGAMILVIRRGLDTSALLVWLTGFVYPFAVISLYLGQTAVRNEHSLPFGYFNLRYAAPAMAFFALLVGFAVMEGDRFGARVRAMLLVSGLVVALAFGFLAWSYADPRARIGVIAEGYTNSEGSEAEQVAARWLGMNYNGGGVLIDEGANPVLIQLGMSLADVTATYTGADFETAKANPAAVKWIYTNTQSGMDRVWNAIVNNPEFATRFAPAYRDGPITIWARFQ
jgi:hypothetical protein